VKDYLLDLLLDLDGIEQDPYYHPEGDALYHSLQVFQLAHQQSESPILWTAALFHDIGKANGSKNHDRVGAEMLQGVLSDQIVWLIEHHLDLLISFAQTKRKLKTQPLRLRQLEQLRQWDVSGRAPTATVLSPQQAIALLDPFLTQIVA
jgi:putative nucleotidyltransferase with HDIG domain